MIRRPATSAPARPARGRYVNPIIAQEHRPTPQAAPKPRRSTTPHPPRRSSGPTVRSLAPSHSFTGVPTHRATGGTTPHPSAPRPVSRQGGGTATRPAPVKRSPAKPRPTSAPAEPGTGSMSGITDYVQDVATYNGTQQGAPAGGGSQTSSDIQTLQAQYSALAQQVALDEQSAAQTQGLLNQLAAAPSTTTQGSTGLLSSSTGKVVLAAALIGGGAWWYLRSSKKGKTSKKKGAK